MPPPAPLLGVHVSVVGGLPNAYKNGVELGCGGEARRGVTFYRERS